LFPVVRDNFKNVDLIFSHNDIQENNLIYKHDLKQIELIDFEYSALNFRGADLASLINELAIEYSPDLPG